MQIRRNKEIGYQKMTMIEEFRGEMQSFFQRSLDTIEESYIGYEQMRQEIRDAEKPSDEAKKEALRDIDELEKQTKEHEEETRKNLEYYMTNLRYDTKN